MITFKRINRRPYVLLAEIEALGAAEAVEAAK